MWPCDGVLVCQINQHHDWLTEVNGGMYLSMETGASVRTEGLDFDPGLDTYHEGTGWHATERNHQSAVHNELERKEIGSDNMAGFCAQEETFLDTRAGTYKQPQVWKT